MPPKTVAEKAVRRPSDEEIKPFKKAMATFMDTISHDAKSANVCIYAAFPAAELNIELSNDDFQVYQNENGSKKHLKQIEMELWLFHHPDQGLEAARNTFSRTTVGILKKLIKTPRPWRATHHFEKARLKCASHGKDCYRFEYTPAPPRPKAVQRAWKGTKGATHVDLELYKSLNALDDHILGEFRYVQFARIPFLSVPVAALFQPCKENSEKIVKKAFHRSILKLRQAAPVYVLSAIREVAAYYTTRVAVATLKDDLGKKAARLCMDLALASVLFPLEITLRGTRGCSASSRSSLASVQHLEWGLLRARKAKIKFLDHHNYYLHRDAVKCRRASKCYGAEIFLNAIRHIEETLAHKFRRVDSKEYRERPEVSCVMFDFFMPLAHEGELRTVLDDLFYKDRILERLEEIELRELKEIFGAKREFDELIGYVCDWIDQNFVGYSISHVAGRFRAHDLKEFRQAVLLDVENSGRYLMDETTAVVRFIFPCAGTTKAAKDHAKRVRFIFRKIFVTQMLKSVKEENQIWLLESGMQNRLYRWEKAS